MDDDERSPLEADYRDQLISYGKAAASLVPLVGGIVGEILSSIPGQRADRIARYIELLEGRVISMEGDLRLIMSDPEKVDLVEEGGFQAARATSYQRIEHIANLVAAGLTSEDTNIVRRKRLAALLRQVDDDELMLLRAYGLSTMGDRSGWNAIEIPPPPTMGYRDRSIPEARELFDAGAANLVRLGLIEKKYLKPPRGQAPQFDPEKGDFKNHLQISYLGRMLLRSVGLPDPFGDEG